MPEGRRHPSHTPHTPPTAGSPGSNGKPHDNGTATVLGKPSHEPRPAAPPERGPLAQWIHYGSIGLIVIFCVGIPLSIPYLRRDPIVWDMTILFSGVTGAAGGAVAGIALVVFGGARGRRWMVVAGVVVGLLSFAILGVTVVWALNHNAPKATPQATLVPPSPSESDGRLRLLPGDAVTALWHRPTPEPQAYGTQTGGI